jgi:hypothetical protein
MMITYQDFLHDLKYSGDGEKLGGSSSGRPGFASAEVQTFWTQSSQWDGRRVFNANYLADQSMLNRSRYDHQ